MSNPLTSIKTMKALFLSLLVTVGLFTASSASADSSVRGIVYHISDDFQASRAMVQITNQMAEMPETPVVVIGVGKGVQFMLEGVKDENGFPFSARIEQLIAHGAEFYACQNTLDTFEISTDELGFGIDTVRSGIAAISKYQLEKNYAYIKP